MAQLGRRHKELSEQAALGAALARASQGIADARGMLEGEADAEMRTYLEAELATSEEALAGASRRSCGWRCSSATRTTSATSSSSSARAPAATRRRSSPATSTTCSRPTPQRLGYQDGDAQRDRQRPGRIPRGDVRGHGRRRLLGVQMGVRRAPRAARARDRVPGAHPHLDDDRRGAARGRGRRGGPRPPRTSRSTSCARPAPAASRSTRPTPRCASRTCRPASSSPARTSARRSRTASARSRSCARASTSARSRSATRPRRPSGSPRSARASAPRRSAPTTIPSGASPITASSSPSHNLDAVLAGDLSAFTQALQDADRSRRLEAASQRVSTVRELLGPHASTWRARACRSPRLDAEYLLAHVLGCSGSSSTSTTIGRSSPPRSTACASSCAAAGARAARLRARQLGLLRPRAALRRPRARAAARDGAARRALPGALPRASRRRASSTSARAPARSRWRSRRGCPTRRVTAIDVSPTRSHSPPRTPPRNGLAERVELLRGRPARAGRRAAASTWSLEPALRRAGRRRRPRGRRLRAGARGLRRRRGRRDPRPPRRRRAGRCAPGGDLALELGEGQAPWLAERLAASATASR